MPSLPFSAAASVALLVLVASDRLVADLVHRWSLNQPSGPVSTGTTVTDSVGNAPATIRGTGATSNGAAIILPGSTTGNQAPSSISAYIDLPNGMISSRTNLTVEIWAAPLSQQNFQRLLDFGRITQAGDGLGAAGEITGLATVAPGTTSSFDGLTLTLSRNEAGNLSQQRFETRANGAGAGGTTGQYGISDTNFATIAGTEYHYVLTFQSGVGAFASTGGRASWYRNGTLVTSLDTSFRLNQIQDVNNWLGRSHWSGDRNTHAAYNEVRVYDHAMTPAEITASFSSGPDPAFPLSDIAHRWSFGNTAGNATSGTTVPDLIGTATATVRGNGATFTGTALTLPGSTNGNQSPSNISAYVDLPNGIISSRTSITIELWATQVAARNWQRIMDFGRTHISGNNAAQGTGAAPGEILHTATVAPGATTSSDNLMLAINRSTNANQQRLAGRLNDAAELITDSNVTLATGTRHHFAITFTDGAGSAAGSGGQLAWYLNGALAATRDLPFKLSAIEDVNNWLGRSQFGGDSCANITYDEVRIHRRALTPVEILNSISIGPNPNFPPPVIVADAATLHRLQKVRIAVLANDSGTLDPTTVNIVQSPQFGTTTISPNGSILYTHTTGSPVTDSFTYRVNGAGGQSQPATVTLTFSDQLRIPNSSFQVPTNPPPVSIAAVNAFSGLSFNQPVCIASPPGDTQRVFICEKTGLLRVIPNVTATTPTASTVLTLSSATGGLFNGRNPAEALNSNSECGLLGMAFHPNYASNGHVFLFYSVNIGGALHQRVSRITFNNPNSATPTANLASERVLIQQADQADNHNGGDLHFGPDGYLYISLGDEGGQNDQFANSQRINQDFFAGMLRIDVNLEGTEIAGNPAATDDANVPPNSHPAVVLHGGLPAYEIPADNPWVGATSFNGIAVTPSTVRTEFWAAGLRNPWRFSFDPVTGELWCGDVGGGAREEISLITRGGNYGWVWREGTVAGPVGGAPGGFSHINPLYDYQHGSGNFQGRSVTGGLVYRGTRMASLTGAYVFADYVSGNVWSLVRNGSSAPTVNRLLGEGGIVAFGRDPSNGDVLMADLNDNLIRRITTVTDTSTYPTTLTATGLFSDLTDLSPSPGLLPYQINLPFWSDHAIKRRWFTIPGSSSKMTWSRDGEWIFPTGQIWVKHFDIETTRGNPATRKRLETRLLVKNASGAYGVSYRWNEAGTEANLVGEPGEDFDLSITVGGVPQIQRWRIPSRSECLTCHTPQAGFALSTNTRQYHMASIIPGFSGNQIEVLENGGYFSNTPDSPNLLPRHLHPDETTYPAEARVRSYIAVNCAYCHMDGGTAAPSMWDGRHELVLDQTGLILGDASNNGGNPLNKLVVPGSTTHSILLNRTAASNGFTRMPPLGSNVVDPAGVTLLTDWIRDELPARQTYGQWRSTVFRSGTSSQSEPGADPDGDGADNRTEFLAGTDPTSGSSLPLSTIRLDGEQAAFTYDLPPNRSAIIEHSENLHHWQPWNIPGNQGLPTRGGPQTLTGPKPAGTSFFRAKVMEN
jgi:glucose/arabinose dehydrogenase